MERMRAHATGMIGFPLRLLARENYDRLVELEGRAHVALITGEEKIVPPRPRWWICTVEAMPLGQAVAFLARAGLDQGEGQQHVAHRRARLQRDGAAQPIERPRWIAGRTRRVGLLEQGG
eukprot:g14155.t1